MYRNGKRGFTLIELLVVIAIIGILSSVVLASLNTARSKGNDAKSKAQLSGARAAAEIYYSDQSPNSYGAAVAGNEAVGLSIGTGCDSGMFANATLAQYTKLSNYPADAGGGSPVVGLGKCTSTGTAYTMTVKLNAAATFWCVDGTGSSKSIGALPANSATSC